MGGISHFLTTFLVVRQQCLTRYCTRLRCGAMPSTAMPSRHVLSGGLGGLESGLVVGLCLAKSLLSNLLQAIVLSSEERLSVLTAYVAAIPVGAPRRGRHPTSIAALEKVVVERLAPWVPKAGASCSRTRTEPQPQPQPEPDP